MATFIKPEAIKDGTISASKTDETMTFLPLQKV